jgi:hypothetical protein
VGPRQVYYADGVCLFGVLLAVVSGLSSRYFSQASVEHSKESVFPVPVGLCSSEFSRQLRERIIEVMYSVWIGYGSNGNNTGMPAITSYFCLSFRSVSIRIFPSISNFSGWRYSQ